MKPGDKVQFNPEHPDVEALERDFGIGPFEILAVEDDLCSLKRCSDGLAWISYKNAWESPESGEKGLYKAIPPIFHRDWLASV